MEGGGKGGRKKGGREEKLCGKDSLGSRLGKAFKFVQTIDGWNIVSMVQTTTWYNSLVLRPLSEK